MTLESTPLEILQMVYFQKTAASGAISYKTGKVVDVNEHCKIVKLEIVTNPKLGRMRRDWIPLAKLSRTVPQTETKTE